MIIDEIQRVPALSSYIQAVADEEQRNGRFVLTGSHQPHVRVAVTQSLASRVALLHLLPLSIRELHAALFEKFIKLLAGRCGPILEVGSLAADTGVDAKTARKWLAVMEASFVIFQLPSCHENFGKRVIKAPKNYFTEVGLLCFVLGLREAAQVARDPLVGQIFENLVVMECLKARYNRGEMPDLHFFRDSNRQEVDLVSPVDGELLAAEIKAASTFNTSLLAGLRRFRDLATGKKCRPFLTYNGQPLTTSDGTTALNFADFAELFD